MAKESYKNAADYNLSHHWSIVQFLSLQTILEGYPEGTFYWHAAFQAASNDELSKDKYKELWALGSKAELFLLAPHLVVAEKKVNIENCFKGIVTKIEEDRFPIDSTKSQFMRYINWWKEEKGYTKLPNPIPLEELQLLIQLLQ